MLSRIGIVFWTIEGQISVIFVSAPPDDLAGGPSELIGPKGMTMMPVSLGVEFPKIHLVSSDLLVVNSIVSLLRGNGLGTSHP